MSGQVVAHRRAAVSPKARVVTRRRAPGWMWRLEEKRVTLGRWRAGFARMVATTPHAPWVTEEAVEARRPRHLLGRQSNVRVRRCRERSASVSLSLLAEAQSWGRYHDDKEAGWKVTIVSHGDDILTEVLNALYWDLAVPPHRVKIELENGWVTMSGIVDRPYQRNCAELDARRVPGVVGVTNQNSARAGPVGPRVHGRLRRRNRLHGPPRELPMRSRNGCSSRRFIATIGDGSRSRISALKDTEHERHGKVDPRTGL